MNECVLCRIVRGELKPRIVAETARSLAVINDGEPMARGHVVFFPKAHAPRLDELEDATLGDVLVLIKRAAKALGLENYNVLQNNGALAGQTVFHAHFHLIPRWGADEGLRYTWERGQKFDHDDVYRTLKERLESSR